MPVLHLGGWPKKTGADGISTFIGAKVFPGDEIKRKQYITAQILSLKNASFINTTGNQLNKSPSEDEK